MAKDKRDQYTIDMFEKSVSQPVSLPGADRREARARERGPVVNSDPERSALSTGR